MPKKRLKRILLWLTIAAAPFILLIILFLASLLYAARFRSVQIPDTPSRLESLSLSPPRTASSPAPPSDPPTTFAQAASPSSAADPSTLTAALALARELFTNDAGDLSPNLQAALPAIEQYLADMLWQMKRFETTASSMSAADAHSELSRFVVLQYQTLRVIGATTGKPYWRWSVADGGRIVSRLYAFEAQWQSEQIHAIAERGDGNRYEWQRAAKLIGLQMEGWGSMIELEASGHDTWPRYDTYYEGPARPLIDLQQDCLNRAGGWNGYWDGVANALGRRRDVWAYRLNAIANPAPPSSADAPFPPATPATTPPPS